MEKGHLYPKAQRKGQSYLFSTTEVWFHPAPSLTKTKGKKICCRFCSINAYAEQIIVVRGRFSATEIVAKSTIFSHYQALQELWFLMSGWQSMLYDPWVCVSKKSTKTMFRVVETQSQRWLLQTATLKKLQQQNQEVVHTITRQETDRNTCLIFNVETTRQCF